MKIALQQLKDHVVMEKQRLQAESENLVERKQRVMAQEAHFDQGLAQYAEGPTLTTVRWKESDWTYNQELEEEKAIARDKIWLEKRMGYPFTSDENLSALHLKRET